MDEMKKAIASKGELMPEAELKAIMQAADVDGGGCSGPPSLAVRGHGQRRVQRHRWAGFPTVAEPVIASRGPRESIKP